MPGQLSVCVEGDTAESQQEGDGAAVCQALILLAVGFIGHVGEHLADSVAYGLEGGRIFKVLADTASGLRLPLLPVASSASSQR